MPRARPTGTRGQASQGSDGRLSLSGSVGLALARIAQSHWADLNSATRRYPVNLHTSTALRGTNRSTVIEPTTFPLVAAVPICVEPCRGHRSEPLPGRRPATEKPSDIRPWAAATVGIPPALPVTDRA